ncbi:glycoside hydrolase superfamily [Radiomyces spectabilis]|uniref:glycoside hydrolase superfamily n=1 Tax=Radiomyces spectabilis TaxID=64574 RepID=UPI002220EAD2|nr:glycoside hydrolase superfamily [Radiomyces spectabilis]KAI8393744.1 glycoside hydrolase superfamily [Radiomyces spectabilis]
MKLSSTKFIGVAGSILLALSGAQAAFPDGHNVVSYWGQNSAGGGSTQDQLASYCDDSSDVLIMSFLTDYNVGSLPSLNLANACVGTNFPGTNLLKCDKVGEDIKKCQKKGKKVLLSLGGASGAYGFKSDAEGKTFAKTLWDIFGGGDSDTRPFGDAVVDGFDLDIEGGGGTGYVALIKELRSLFAKDSSKDYYITAAPQCPFPDAMLGTVIDEAGVDAVNVQFYNNYCSTASSSFNFDTWDNWAKTKSPNKDVKVFIGIPGSSSAAGSGYVAFEQLKDIVKSVASTYSSYGGVSIWDASQSYGNTEVSPNYAAAVAKLVKEGSSSSGSDEDSGSNDNDNDSSDNDSNDDDSTSSSSSKPTPTTDSPHNAVVTSKSLTATSTKASQSSQPTSSAGDDKDDSNDGSDSNDNDNANANANDSDSDNDNSDPSCVKDGDSCSNEGQYVCTGKQFAVCNHGEWMVQSCRSGQVCFSTTDKTSIYCAPGTGASDTCSAKSPKKAGLTTLAKPEGAVARPFKSSRVTSGLSVTKSDEKSFEALINARKMDIKPFKGSVMVQFTAPPNIKVTHAENGKVKQNGQNVKIQLKNPKKKSMSLVFSIKGSVHDGVFTAPDAKSMKFGA